METYTYTIEEENHKSRLDKALSVLCDDLSRARVQGVIRDGGCRVNGVVVTNLSHKVVLDNVVELQVPDAVPSEILPEDIPLDIIYEDDELLVINKPVGMVVHPGAGNVSGTMVNALLHYCGDSLSGIGGVQRPGIVHRLDKDTSGLLMVAKTDRAHQGLSEQLSDRTLSRVYHALVIKVPTPLKGAVDIAIGRHSSHRVKMAVMTRGSKEARTNYRVLSNYNDACSLVECRLESGRTHQIRVHMAHIRHPLIGDPLYGAQKTAVMSALRGNGYEEDVVEAVLSFGRQALHAKSISFVHPVSGEQMSFDSDLPDDFSKLLKMLK